MTAAACNLQLISRMLTNDLYIDHLSIYFLAKTSVLDVCGFLNTPLTSNLVNPFHNVYM